ncbi:hypothetical protein T261_06501 [Streptomyces lydicus]|nr:hypothetical protein T261_06501 [Streptomyces lydicus]
MQPHRRQGGAVCGHLGLSSSTGTARATPKRRRNSPYLGRFTLSYAPDHLKNLDNFLAQTGD